MFQAYRVVSIFYQNSSLHVVDENLPLAVGCPTPCFNLSLSMGFMPAFAISRANSELRFLSRCDEPVPEAVPGFQRMPCDNYSFVGFRWRFGRSYGGREHGATPPLGCLVAVVPTLPATDRDSRHNYVASLRSGFLLEWTVVSDSQGTAPSARQAAGNACTLTTAWVSPATAPTAYITQ